MGSHIKAGRRSTDDFLKNPITFKPKPAQNMVKSFMVRTAPNRRPLMLTEKEKDEMLLKYPTAEVVG